VSAPWAPDAIRVEHRTEASPVLGLGTPRPRLSWTTPGAPSSFRQAAYTLEVTRADGALTEATVDTSDQVLVPWPLEPLRSREAVAVRIRVRGHDGSGWSDYSRRCVIEVGLLRAEDWTARLISPRTAGGLGMPAPVLSSTFTVAADVISARLHISAHGVLVATLNGRRVGDENLAPGWTSYPSRLRYRTHDVTALLIAGINRIEVLLGNGWFRGRLMGSGPAHYGDRLALLAQLEIMTGSGLQVIGTDTSWRARSSGVIADDLYDGQSTDLRSHVGPAPALDDVAVVEGSLHRLVAADGPPVRVTDVLPALSSRPSASGGIVLDFGQNVVGWVRLRTRDRPAGSTVTVRHAEVLELDGELAIRPLRSARATDTYVLAGSAEEVLEPALTYHGFRYADVSGAGPVDTDDAEAVVIGSDLPRTGWFTCSDPEVNRLHENAYWSLRGNTVDLPTDCPQRDERLGWTGDIQVFAPAAAFLADCAGFLTSWLGDLAAEQHADGSVPFVIPDTLGMPAATAAAWGDAATVVPWVLYQRSGDSEVVRRQFPSMCAWVERIAADAGPTLIWNKGLQFGDWLDPSAPPEDPGAGRTPKDLVATAHLARSAGIVADAADLVGDTGAAERYRRLAADTRAAFQAEFVTRSGRVVGDTQTAYAMAIVWDLLANPEQRAGAGRRLADLVRIAGFRITTGFVGTPLVAEALTLAGEVEVAYRLLRQRGCPSWLYPLTMGATTIWERWDSMLPDGSINPGRMTSFNHYAFGAVVDWLHRYVAGLAPAAPGYREVAVRPRPGRGLTAAAARHQSPYGAVEVSWRRDGQRLDLDVRVPSGTTATVQVTDQTAAVRVGPGEHHWTVADPVTPAAPPATVRDVMDHDDLWQAVVEAAVSHGAAGGETQVASTCSHYLDAPAEQLPVAVDPLRKARHPEALSEAVRAVLARVTDA